MMRALFLLYAIWGFNWVVMKTANAYFPPVLFVAFRFLIGAAVMLSVCAWRRIPVPMTAVSIVLAGAAAWAASGIILKRHLQDSPPLQYSAWQMVVGSLLLFIVALIVPQPSIHWTTTAAACLLYNGILAAAVGFFLWNYILTWKPARPASPSWSSPSSASSAVSSSWAKPSPGIQPWAFSWSWAASCSSSNPDGRACP